MLRARCFSVAGMGKDEYDGNGSVLKRQIKSRRDSGDGVECANDVLTISSKLKVPAQTYAKLNVVRGNDKQVAKRSSFPHHYHLHTADSSSITFWEYLDPAASVVSIKESGQAVGYGPGAKESLVEF